ncbi:Protein-L-isoaspartate O-methyltransferase [bioreactor metagenome]|uniref:protein-L-isoaspartate(D-aspartate) O-methyltransferase n=1 Tax=bioreactor metagenome TaxID=1076179 RepID=A0A644WJD1_9ZZZZ
MNYNHYPVNYRPVITFKGRLLEDNYRHQGLRKRLVAELEQKGISDPRVLAAIGKIPRHFFMDSSFVEFAYVDKAFPIGEDQTISQPYTVAFQSQLLQIKPLMKVMEIGTGSGYQAIVLMELGAKVYSIERVKALYDRTKEFLPAIGYNPRLFYGDGYKGLPTYGPFDRIIVTAAAPLVPEALLHQLKPGGILVIPVGDSAGVQTMKTITRQNDDTFTEKDHGLFRFVPMVENKRK